MRAGYTATRALCQFHVAIHSQFARKYRSMPTIMALTMPCAPQFHPLPRASVRNACMVIDIRASIMPNSSPSHGRAVRAPAAAGRANMRLRCAAINSIAMDVNGNMRRCANKGAAPQRSLLHSVASASGGTRKKSNPMPAQVAHTQVSIAARSQRATGSQAESAMAAAAAAALTKLHASSARAPCNHPGVAPATKVAAISSRARASRPCPLSAKITPALIDDADAGGVRRRQPGSRGQQIGVTCRRWRPMLDFDLELSGLGSFEDLA